MSGQQFSLSKFYEIIPTLVRAKQARETKNGFELCPFPNISYTAIELNP
jgi:hypothetical protein